MKPITAEWVAKADGDFNIARRESESQPVPADGICFHAQQRAEKYLKACLQEQEVSFPRTHDLIEMLDLFPSPVISLEQIRDELDELTGIGCTGTLSGLLC